MLERRRIKNRTALLILELKEDVIGQVHVEDDQVDQTRKRPSVRSSEFFGLWNNRRDINGGLFCDVYPIPASVKCDPILVEESTPSQEARSYSSRFCETRLNIHAA